MCLWLAQETKQRKRCTPEHASLGTPSLLLLTVQLGALCFTCLLGHKSVSTHFGHHILDDKSFPRKICFSPLTRIGSQMTTAAKTYNVRQDESCHHHLWDDKGKVHSELIDTPCYFVLCGTQPRGKRKQEFDLGLTTGISKYQAHHVRAAQCLLQFGAQPPAWSTSCSSSFSVLHNMQYQTQK